MITKIIKLILVSISIILAFSSLSCDDRKASNTVTEEGLSLSFILSQPVANGSTVGEAIVGYAGVYLIVELRDADGQPVKGGVVTFSSKVLQGSTYSSYGEFDVNSVTTGSDGRAFVTYSASSGSGAVDNPTTPLFENVEVIAYYGENVEVSSRFDVYGSKDDVWPYTFTMTSPTPEEITLAAETPSNLTCRLLNKSGTPVRNVIVQLDAGEKGYIEIDDNVVSSDTTNNNGEISFSFQDYGEQENIGIAIVKATFQHPSINSSVIDSSTISIVSEVGLVQECTYVEIPSSVPDNIVVKEGGDYIPEADVTEDLVIQIIEQTHDLYKRKNNDIYIEHEITLAESLCGLNTTIPHLSGPLKIEINEIIKPNSLYKVEGKGMPIKITENNELTPNEVKNTQYGDLIIDFIIQFPSKLDSKRIDLLKKILDYKDNNDTSDSLVGYYYKNKEDIVKEIMNEQNNNETEEEIGCIQQ